MNNELERIWKEVVMACFKVLFQHSSGKTEENHRNINQENAAPSEILTPRVVFMHVILSLDTMCCFMHGYNLSLTLNHVKFPGSFLKEFRFLRGAHKYFVLRCQS
jgi:hypothetical protein